jgi:uncharacterized protein (TIGR02118 family)
MCCYSEPEQMIKVIVAIVRKPGLSPKEFHTHWRTHHAQLVVGSDVTKRYIRRYIQAHTASSEYANGEPAFDGMAELWFDSIEDKDRFYSVPNIWRISNRTSPASRI